MQQNRWLALLITLMIVVISTGCGLRPLLKPEDRVVVGSGLALTRITECAEADAKCEKLSRALALATAAITGGKLEEVVQREYGARTYKVARQEHGFSGSWVECDVKCAVKILGDAAREPGSDFFWGVRQSPIIPYRPFELELGHTSPVSDDPTATSYVQSYESLFWKLTDHALAGHLAHEYLHTRGFRDLDIHIEGERVTEEKVKTESIPYSLGRAVCQVAAEIDKKPGDDCGG